MKGTGSKRHIHKYRKLDNGIWACALPDCTHFMPKNIPNGVLGKNSICFGCAEVFLMNEESMQEDFPECHKCLAKRGNSPLSDIDKILAEKGIA